MNILAIQVNEILDLNNKSQKGLIFADIYRSE